MSTSPVLVKFAFDVSRFERSMQRAVEALSSIDFAGLSRSLEALGMATKSQAARHQPIPLPIDGDAYRRRSRNRKGRR